MWKKWTHCLELRLRELEALKEQWVAWRELSWVRSPYFLCITSQILLHRLDSFRFSCRSAPFCIFIVCPKNCMNFIKYWTGCTQIPYARANNISAKERSYTSMWRSSWLLVNSRLLNDVNNDVFPIIYVLLKDDICPEV